MAELHWETPAPAERGNLVGRSAEIDAEVEVLKQHPGQWARVVTGASSAQRRKAYKARGCEVTTRGPGRGPFDIYARWPEDGDSAILD